MDRSPQPSPDATLRRPSSVERTNANVLRVRSVLAALMLVAASCGGGAPDPSPAAPTTMVPTTPMTSTTVPPTSTTVPPTSTSPPDSSVPTPTEPTPPPATVPEPIDGTLLGPPSDGLLDALPPGAIDWAEVGPGWALLDHGPGFGEPVTLDARGLYLIAPDDSVYGVSALPTDGSWLAAAADDGRHALLQSFDPTCADGCTCNQGAAPTVETDEPDSSGLVGHEYGYVLLDLVRTVARPLIDPVPVPVCDSGVFRREVSFTSDGGGVWVTETWYTADRQRAERVRLARVDLDTGAWTTVLERSLADVDVSAATSPTLWMTSIVDLGDRIVVGALDEIWLWTNDGDPIRRLGDSGTPCSLLDVLDADHVIARCVVPADMVGSIGDRWCRPSGVWSIALDGSPARPLAVREHDGQLDCWASYTDVARLDGALAIQVSGDGASEGVDIVDTDGDVTPWMPPDMPDTFTETLLGVRDATWLVSAQNEFGDSGVYAVTPESSIRIDLPPGRVIVL